MYDVVYSYKRENDNFLGPCILGIYSSCSGSCSLEKDCWLHSPAKLLFVYWSLEKNVDFGAVNSYTRYSYNVWVKV